MTCDSSILLHQGLPARGHQGVCRLPHDHYPQRGLPAEADEERQGVHHLREGVSSATKVHTGLHDNMSVK